MTSCRVFCWIGLVLLIAVGTRTPTSWADEEPASGDGAPQQAQAEFDRRFAAYKDALRKIEKLNTDFQTADASARDRINAQLQDQVADAKARLDTLIAAAMDVYRLAPNADPQIANLIAAVARFYTVGEETRQGSGVINGGDNYEQALPIIRQLVDGGADVKQLPVWGLLTAFAINDYDLAENFFEQAKKAEALADPRSIDDPAAREVMAKVLQFAGAFDQYRELWAKEKTIRDAEAAAADLPRVKLSTTKGEIVIELYENEAPQTVANFVTLAKQGYYDGLAFHRVLHCFMAQGGDPQGDGSGGPGYSIRCECYQPNYRRHFRGTLSMAHAGRDTGGSQFFLTFVPTPHLDGKHTAFGRVVEGIEVLGELQKREPTGDLQRDASLPQPDRIVKAEVLRDRGHEYEFEKLPGR